MEPQIIRLGLTVDQYIPTLLYRFRQCDSYADKLELWEENDLTERLFYNIYEEDKNTVFAFDTWESVKNLPILTLTPFTYAESEQFTQWALQIRKGVYSYTFEKRRDGAIKRYTNAPSIADKQFTLDSYKRQIEDLKESKFGSDYPLAERTYQIDVSYYMQMILLLRIGESVPLARWVWQAENLAEPHRMNWKLIDTYLFAEGVIQTSVFLEQFNPNDYQSAPEQTNTNQLNLSLAEIAILHHINGWIINPNNADSIAQKYGGHTSGQKLFETYKNLSNEAVRTGPGKNKVKNYRNIESLILPKFKSQYNRELGEVLKANRK